MPKYLTVAKYEYLKTVKRPAFWIATLFFPMFLVVVMAISAFSSLEGSKKLEEISEQIDNIVIIDQTGLISKDYIQPPLNLKENLENSIEKVKSGEVDAVIHYPKDLVASKQIEIYAKENGLLGNVAYSTIAQNLLEQSTLAQIDDPNIQTILTSQFSDKTTVYDDEGNVVKEGAEKFIVPIVSGVIFFVSVFASGQYMLQSVAEEKENRMIENLLSMISSNSLIFGKLVGLSGAVLTQLLTWGILGAIIITVAVNNYNVELPIDLSGISLAALPINIFFILCGFLFFSAVMVGVGAVSTSYKDSQSLSSVFVILSILPMYFITILVADPNGLIARIVSYLPFTSPMVFLIRNSISELPTSELVFGIVLNIAYIAIAVYFALKMFTLGSLMYNRRPSFKEILFLLRK